MDGPRPVTPDELPALRALADSVFAPEDGSMFDRFPLVFREDNADNLLVIEENGVIVSHVALLIRRVSLGGCRVRVACLGAVATDPAYRGRGLATELLGAAQRAARTGGADYIMISGGLNIYRRLGATDVGVNMRTVVDSACATALAQPDLTIETATDADLPRCDELYCMRQAHFIRSQQDWRIFRAGLYCQNRRATLYTLRRDNVVEGYILISHPGADGLSYLLEWAGPAEIVAGGFSLAMGAVHAGGLHVELQPEDAELMQLVAASGHPFEPAHTDDTVLIINMPDLYRALEPYFQETIGVMDTERLSLICYGDSYRFAIDGIVRESLTRPEAARLLFGHHDRPRTNDLLGEVFPIPHLWYGYNYV